MRKIIVSGRLGRDSEIRPTKNGSFFLSAFLISTEFGDPKDETGNPVSMVFSIYSTDSRSISLQRFLTKGKAVIVTGELRVREYVKENGTRGISYDINHAFIDFAPFSAKKEEGEEGKEDGEAGEGTQESPVPTPEIPVPANPVQAAARTEEPAQPSFPPAVDTEGKPVYDDDLPF